MDPKKNITTRDVFVLDHTRPFRGVYVSETINSSTRHEDTDFGTYDFPISISLSSWADLHWHEEFQFCVVLVGQIEFIVNNVRFLLESGEGVFINANVLHAIQPFSSGNNQYVCLNIAPKLLFGFAGSVLEKKYTEPFSANRALAYVPFRRDVPWQAEALSFLEQIPDVYFEKRGGYELQVVGDLLRVWQLLCNNNPEKLGEKSPANTVDEKRIKTLVTYIHGHYADKLTLGDIAGACNISEGECCRLFRRAINMTPFEYLSSVRISQAINLLQNTDVCIAHVAEEVGFSSPSYFIKCFRKTTGTSPREYRQRSARPAEMQNAS